MDSSTYHIIHRFFCPRHTSKFIHKMYNNAPISLWCIPNSSLYNDVANVLLSFYIEGITYSILFVRYNNEQIDDINSSWKLQVVKDCIKFLWTVCLIFSLHFAFNIRVNRRFCAPAKVSMVLSRWNFIFRYNLNSLNLLGNILVKMYVENVCCILFLHQLDRKWIE